MNTLYICVGSTCRGPMAQYYSQATLAKANFRSRGLYGSRGTMSQKFLGVLDREGIDGRAYLGQTPQEEDLAWVGWIVSATWDIQGQLRGLRRDKIFTFRDHGGSEIPDPYGRGKVIYQITYDLLKKNIHLMMETLEG